MGLTGKAFQEGYISFMNLVAANKFDVTVEPIDEAFMNQFKIKCAHNEFMKDIDNSIGAKNFENYMIGSIKD